MVTVFEFPKNKEERNATPKYMDLGSCRRRRDRDRVVLVAVARHRSADASASGRNRERTGARACHASPSG